MTLLDETIQICLLVSRQISKDSDPQVGGVCFFILSFAFGPWGEIWPLLSAIQVWMQEGCRFEPFYSAPALVPPWVLPSHGLKTRALTVALSVSANGS